jgi:hypothetical protein
MKKGIVLMGVGAGLMYLFDPEQGEARRAQLAEKFTGLLPQTKEAIDAKAEAITTQASTLAEKADAMASEKISAIGPEATGGESGGDSGGEGGGSEGESGSESGGESGGSEGGSESENDSAPSGNPT